MNGCGSCSTTWAETLHRADGVGLAAPQVGVLRRVFIMDFGDGKGVIEAVNPRIVERRGKQEDVEGCLSSRGNTGSPAVRAGSKWWRRIVSARSSPLRARI